MWCLLFKVAMCVLRWMGVWRRVKWVFGGLTKRKKKENKVFLQFFAEKLRFAPVFIFKDEPPKVEATEPYLNQQMGQWAQSDLGTLSPSSPAEYRGATSAFEVPAWRDHKNLHNLQHLDAGQSQAWRATKGLLPLLCMGYSVWYEILIFDCINLCFHFSSKTLECSWLRKHCNQKKKTWVKCQEIYWWVSEMCTFHPLKAFHSQSHIRKLVFQSLFWHQQSEVPQFSL